MIAQPSKPIPLRIIGGIVLVLGPLLALAVVGFSTQILDPRPLGSLAILTASLSAIYVCWIAGWSIAARRESMINRLNRRIHKTLGWVLLIATGVIAIAYIAANNESSDMERASLAGADEIFKKVDYGKTLYILINDRDPSEELLTKLNQRNPHLNLLPWSQHPADQRQLRYKEKAVLCAGVCQDLNFVSMSSPDPLFWRVVAIRYGSANTFGNMLLVKVGATWKVISFSQAAI